MASSELIELEAAESDPSQAQEFAALSWPASAPLIRNHLSEMQHTAQILTVVPGLPQSLYHHLAVLRDVLSDAAYEARERGPEPEPARRPRRWLSYAVCCPGG